MTFTCVSLNIHHIER